MIEILLSDHRAILQDGLALGLVVIALIWGGGPERVFALTWLLLFEIAHIAREYLVTRALVFDAIDPFLATIDVVALFVFMMCALYANRNYMLWIAGMQVLAVAAHLARGMVEGISEISYAMMAYLPGWVQLVFFAIGITRHILRRRRFGPYRDWRTGGTHSGLDLPSSFKRSLLGLLGYDLSGLKHK